MQISILIPLYNYDCSDLLRLISEELCQIPNLDYEILLGDDASSEAFKQIYAHYPTTYPNTSVLTFNPNMGASKMRNALADKAAYDALLFFDSDVLPDRGTIQKYLKAIAEQPQSLIFGGFYYDQEDLDGTNGLRYRYGQMIELRSLSERRAKPYKSFISMAFALPKSLMKAHPFPNIGMGYEDALWGANLAKAGASIYHINAPVKHRLKESDEAFLKTLQSYVANLYKHREQFREADIPLLRTYESLCKYRLKFLLTCLDRSEGLIRKLLNYKFSFKFAIKVLKLIYLHRSAELKQGK